MKRFIGLVLAAGLALGAASAVAQPAGQLEDTSQGSMLLATLVGSYSPTLSAAQKAVLTRYRAGETDAKAGNITVSVDQISCTAGAKAETAFACDLKFGANTVHLTARAASQVFAALELVGTYSGSPSTPFGPTSASASAITCTLDATVIAGGTDGGADCKFTPTVSAPAAGAANASAPAPMTVDNDSTLLVAALVGGYSPTLSAADKAALAHYLAGQPTPDAGAGKFAVKADKVLCQSSLHSEVSWSCDLKFGAKTVHLAGEAAAELYADLSLTGLQGDAAMGTDMLGMQPLTCTLDPAAIAAQTNGAACTFTESD